VPSVSLWCPSMDAYSTETWKYCPVLPDMLQGSQASPTVIAVLRCGWVRSIGELILTGESEILGEKPVTVTLCAPRISHGLTWDRTWARAVSCRRLTAWAKARFRLRLQIPTAAVSCYRAGQIFLRLASRPLVNRYRRFGGDLWVRLPGQAVEETFPARTL